MTTPHKGSTKLNARQVAEKYHYELLHRKERVEEEIRALTSIQQRLANEHALVISELLGGEEIVHDHAND
jgi:phage-related minor tail protein